MKIDLVFLLVIGVIVIYQLCNKKVEKMTNVPDNIKEGIRQVYLADIDMIRNISEVAKKLQAGGLVNPGNLRVNGEIKILADNIIKSDGRQHMWGEELLYILNKSGVMIAKGFEGKPLTGTGNLHVQGNKQVNGTINTNSKFLEGGNALIPAGIIIVWYGSTVPGGWALCDGTNGTPDLRNRFIYGAGGPGTGGAGGSATSTFTLSAQNIPAHTHTYTNNYAQDCRNVRASGTGGCWMSGPPGTNYPQTDGGNFSASNNGKAAGAPVTINIIPPYYTLAYIMKK
jgi:microcystin-dependent protein